MVIPRICLQGRSQPSLLHGWPPFAVTTLGTPALYEDWRTHQLGHILQVLSCTPGLVAILEIKVGKATRKILVATDERGEERFDAF